MTLDRAGNIHVTYSSLNDEPHRRLLGKLKGMHCKAHDLDNLYVVETSFFPSSSAVNPALTAMANALRVRDHLSERLGVSATRRRGEKRFAKREEVPA